MVGQQVRVQRHLDHVAIRKSASFGSKTIAGKFLASPEVRKKRKNLLIKGLDSIEVDDAVVYQHPFQPATIRPSFF